MAARTLGLAAGVMLTLALFAPAVVGAHGVGGPRYVQNHSGYDRDVRDGYGAASRDGTEQNGRVARPSRGPDRAARRCDPGTGGTLLGAIAGGLLGNAAAGRRGNAAAGSPTGAGGGALWRNALDGNC